LQRGLSIGGGRERQYSQWQWPHVAEVDGGEVFDLDGQKIYELKGINFYRLSGELVGHLNSGHGTEKRLDRSTDRLFPVRGRSRQMIAEGAGKMIPIKSADRTRNEMQDLEAMAAKLLETARKLPAGPVRHDILKQIGKFRARIAALKVKAK
jgi:hypothetical protein